MQTNAIYSSLVINFLQFISLKSSQVLVHFFANNLGIKI